MRSLVVPALALSLAFLPASRAQTDEPTPIGVLDLTSELVPEAELRLLTDRLRHELVQTGRFRVMERERMQDILKEQGFQQSGCFATECIIEVGQLIGVQRMVAGSVGKIEDIYTLNIRLINVETGEVERSAVKDCKCSLADILTTQLALVAAEIAAPEPERPGRRAATGTSEPTYVRGDVFTTGWTRSRSPYIVTGPIAVKAGNLLTIEPGVDVLFQDGAYVTVEGSLNAFGTMTDSIRFLRGPAAAWGGIRISGGDSSTFAYVRISDVRHDGDGGGIAVAGSGTRVALANCVISANEVTGDGGGLSVLGSDTKVTVSNSVIIGNTTNQNGGGINIKGSAAVSLSFSVVHGNTAGRFGGGVFARNSTGVKIANCTVARNVAHRRGGGIAVDADTSSVQVTNSIVWGNKTSDIWGLSIGAVWLVTSSGKIIKPCPVTAKYSDTQGSESVCYDSSSINADPLFVDPDHGDFHLLPGSPCIDAGDPDSPPDPDGTRPDIGAFYHDQRQGH